MFMKRFLWFSILLTIFSISVWGQVCFTKEDTQKIIESIKTPQTVRAENKELRKELVKMVETQESLNQKISTNANKNQNLIIEYNQLSEKNTLRLCQIFKENGWVTEKLVGDEGVSAILFLIQNSRSYKAQTEFYPILIEAANKDILPKTVLANIVDNIRVRVGQPQIFGTQAKFKDDLIYLYPLLNEERTDEWRKQYDLPPLNIFIKQLELRYIMNVLKSPPLPVPQNVQTKTSQEKNETSLLGISDDEEEILQIDTKLVNLNVRVLNKDHSVPVNLNLNKEDFSLLEDGQEQEVAFFSTTETPFDLVLVLDFSGSTIAKQGLIKDAAQRFVELARPNDRIAVVVFTERIELVSNLTTDKVSVIEKIKKVDMTGGSYIWGAVKFTYDNIIKKESVGRRSAMILMTDAIDGTKEMTYADIFEIVRKNETTIFPVYLEPERFNPTIKIYNKAKQSMWLLAEESGGTAYQVRKIKDLSGIYEQIINDLGKVYSIGYESKNEKQDGGWRNLTVKIKTNPNLIVKTRQGYYAK